MAELEILEEEEKEEECTGNCKTCGLDCATAPNSGAIIDERFLGDLGSDDYFKVAVVMRDSMVANNLDMKSSLKVFDLDEDKNVVNEGMLFPMENTVKATSLADYFVKMRIKVIITGSVSPVLKKQLEECGIQVFSGARGSISFAFGQYQKGKLK